MLCSMDEEEGLPKTSTYKKMNVSLSGNDGSFLAGSFSKIEASIDAGTFMHVR